MACNHRQARFTAIWLERFQPRGNQGPNRVPLRTDSEGRFGLDVYPPYQQNQISYQPWKLNQNDNPGQRYV